MTTFSVLSAVLGGLAILAARPPSHWVATVRGIGVPGTAGRVPARIRPGRRTVGVLAVLLAVGLLAMADTAAHALLGIAVAAAAGTSARIWVLRRAQAKRRERQKLIAEALETLADSLRAGLTPASALAQIDDRAADLLAPARAASTMGGDVSFALTRSAHWPGAEALWSAGSAWRVAERCGAPLAEVLDNVTENARQERELSRQIAAGVSPARATAQLMAVLPAFGLIIGRGLGADPVAVVTESVAGAACACAGVCLACAGLWWVERIAYRLEST